MRDGQKPETAIIKMRSGRHVDLMRPEDCVHLIDIDDIAYSLSRTNRFGGHTSRSYSVAEHCILGVGQSLPENQLAFLLHDASEAYLGDIAGPLKRSAVFAEYRALEERWQAAICNRYGLRGDAKKVHETDKRMLVTEQRDLTGRAPASSDPYLPFAMQIPQTMPDPNWLAECFVAKFYALTKVTVGAKR